MPQFEYKVVDLHVWNDVNGPILWCRIPGAYDADTPHYEDALNALGAEGWELLHPSWPYVFKRVKPDQ
jgi:hypothetical protein